MKTLSFVLVSLLALITSCNSKKENPSTALDVGREFIRASLDGDFKDAQQFLKQDEANKEFFESYKAYYKRLTPEDKKKYKEASYEINNLLDLNDSTVIINYSNTYMKKPMEIKVIKSNNNWSVDFTYTASGNLPIN